MGIDKKTLHIKDYNNETGIQLHKRFLRGLVNIDDMPIEEMFGDLHRYKKFEWSIKTIRRNLGG